MMNDYGYISFFFGQIMDIFLYDIIYKSSKVKLNDEMPLFDLLSDELVSNHIKHMHV